MQHGLCYHRLSHGVEQEAHNIRFRFHIPGIAHNYALEPVGPMEAENGIAIKEAGHFHRNPGVLLTGTGQAQVTGKPSSLAHKVLVAGMLAVWGFLASPHYGFCFPKPPQNISSGLSCRMCHLERLSPFHLGPHTQVSHPQVLSREIQWPLYPRS